MFRGVNSVKWRTAALVCLACIVEGADMAVLPAVYLFIARSLKASPSQLALMTLCRALMQALASPISGVLGDTSDRTIIIATGAFIWSVCTIGVSMSTSLVQACSFTSMNGLGLALVIPCAQSLMADYFPAEQRGRAFGAMQLTMSLGSMVGSLYATNVAKYQPWGVEGWRIAMRTVSLVSFAVGVSVALVAVDPREHVRASSAPTKIHKAMSRNTTSSDDEHNSDKDLLLPKQPAAAGNRSTSTTTRKAQALSTSGEAAGGALEKGKDGSHSFPGSSWRARHAAIMGSLKLAIEGITEISSLRTFQIIIAQGIVGTMPWNAITFLTLWLQLLGFSDWEASVLSAAFYGASSSGAFIGGYVADRAAQAAPNSGRVITAQFSAFSGIPLTLILVLVLPTAAISTHFSLYMAVIIVFGLLTTWCGAGCNSPIFAEIVSPSKRSLIYAFDRCFEGALAACATPLVGIIAERVFGYDYTRVQVAGEPAADPGNASALGNSLVYCLCVPWSLCFLFYFGLYFTYPADRARRKEALELEKSAPDM